MIITLNLIFSIISLLVGLWWFCRMRQKRTLSLLGNLEYLFLVIACIYSSITCMIVAQHNASIAHIIVHIVEDFFTLFIVPVIYNIIAEITMNNVRKRKIRISFLIALLFGIIIAALHLTSRFSADVQSSFIMYANKCLFIIVIFLQLLILEYAMLADFHAYRQKIYCYYVDIQTTDFAKAHNILVCFFFITFIAYLQLLFQRSSIDIDGNDFISLIINLCVATIIYVVGWNMSHISGETVVVDVSHRPYTPAEIVEMTKIAGREFKENKMMYGVPSADESPSTKAIEDIIGHWTQRADKPYLKEGISLAMAADDMGLNVRIVSIYLNTVLQLNFNAWINTLRIEEVKRILDSRSAQPVSVIACKCGFADTPMLSKNFKKIVGMTITEYKKKNNLI